MGRQKKRRRVEVKKVIEEDAKEWREREPEKGRKGGLEERERMKKLGKKGRQSKKNKKRKDREGMKKRVRER